MRKLLLLLFAAFIATWAALPFWFGLQAEKNFGRAMQQGRATSSIVVTEHAFHRGWLASTATMTLTYPGAPIGLKLTHRIDHGPVPLSRWLTGDFDMTLAAAKVASQGQIVRRNAGNQVVGGGSPTITGETVVQLNGEGETRFTVREFGSGARGTLRGGHGRLHFSPDLKRWQTEISIDSAALSDAALASQGVDGIQAKSMRFTADLSESPQGLWLGTTELAFGEFIAAPMVKLENIRLRSTTRPQGTEVDVATSQQIEAIHVGDESLGSLRMTVNVKRLNARPLAQFERELGQLTRGNTPAEQLSLQILGKTLNLMATLSKTAPELEVHEFVFRSRQGEIKGRAKFVLDGRKLDVTQNPMLLLVALKGEAELQVPKAIMRTFFAGEITRDINGLKAGGKLKRGDASRLDQAAIDQVIDEALPLYVASHDVGRYFHPEGEHYKVTTSIRRGQVFINNQLWQGGLPGVSAP